MSLLLRDEHGTVRGEFHWQQDIASAPHNLIVVGQLCLDADQLIEQLAAAPIDRRRRLQLTHKLGAVEVARHGRGTAVVEAEWSPLRATALWIGSSTLLTKPLVGRLIGWLHWNARMWVQDSARPLSTFEACRERLEHLEHWASESA